MNELIHITQQAIGADAVQTVNARELHQFLGVARDFSNWIKDQLDRARLKENRDFVISAEKGENSGRPRTDYHLTLEAAKHVAMMSGTDKGFEIRDYFIECERQAKNPGAALTRMQLIQLAMESEQRALELEAEKLLLAADKAALEHRVEADAPKVAFHDKVIVAPGAITLSEAAKILGTGRTRLTASLRQLGWLRRNNEPYQNKIEAGLLDVKLGEWTHPDFGLQRSVTALVTGKGLAKLQAILKFEHVARPADLVARHH